MKRTNPKKCSWHFTCKNTRICQQTHTGKQNKLINANIHGNMYVYESAHNARTHTHTHTHTHTINQTLQMKVSIEKKRQQEESQCENRCVLSEVLKEVTDSVCLRGAGRLFHVVGAWQEKDRCPQVFVLTEGIQRSLVSDEERRGREGVQIWTSSDRYSGQVPQIAE